MKRVIIICFLLITGTLNAQELRIGIISDVDEGQGRLSTIKNLLQEEIQKTIGTSINVIINDKDVIAIGWDAKKAQDTYRTLSERCDFVMLIGVLSARSILKITPLPKPTLAIGIANVDLQEIPITASGTSGVKNFSYVLTSRDLENEIEQFKQLVDFKKLALLVHDKAILTVDTTRANESIRQLSRQFNTEINLVPITQQINQSLNALPAGTDAVIIQSIYELDNNQIEEMSKSLIGRKIPSYALRKDYVELGVMASVSADNDLGSLIRKIAIMVDDIQQGAALEDLSVNLDIKQQLYFNVATSNQINYSPTFQTLFTANLVDADESGTSTKYGLGDILERAFNENLDIQITYRDVDLAEQNVKLANSEYLPTAEIAFDATTVNENSTSEFLGQSQRSLSQSATIDQVIYSEELSASVRIEKYLLEAQKFATKQEINDIILGVYTAYFNILLAKSSVTIQKENLELLKKNLELAQLQKNIGASNSSDVYRWEAEVADATQEIIEGQTDLILAKSQLNVFLNNTLEEDFEVNDITLEDNLYSFFETNIIASDIEGPDDVWTTSQFLTEEAKTNYPPRQEINNNILALERQLKGNKRAYYTPTVGLGFNQQEIFERGGSASTETPNSNFINSTWSIGLNVSYPVFDGNRRHINLQKTLVQQDQLNLSLKQFDNDLAFNIKSATVDLVTSRTNINYSQISSESSWKNFQIMQDYYRQGRVSVVQLFDAQNSALETKLAYNNSVYNFLVAFVTLENNVGFYSMLASQEAKDEYELRYQNFKANQDN